MHSASTHLLCEAWAPTSGSQESHRRPSSCGARGRPWRGVWARARNRTSEISPSPWAPQGAEGPRHVTGRGGDISGPRHGASLASPVLAYEDLGGNLPAATGRKTREPGRRPACGDVDCVQAQPGVHTGILYTLRLQTRMLAGTVPTRTLTGLLLQKSIHEQTHTYQDAPTLHGESAGMRWRSAASRRARQSDTDVAYTRRGFTA